jgi:hypothetical protein
MQVFISYRREDTRGFAFLLKDALGRHFPDAEIFLDVDSIPVGESFPDHLRKQIAASDAFLVLIGDEWLRRRDNLRPLYKEGDFVRTEIKEALDSKVRVIPVLVERSQMPRAAELPDDIRELAFIQAFEINDRSWQADVATLVTALGPVASAQTPNRTAPATLTLPNRVTERWLKQNVPPLSRAELIDLIERLRERGWDERSLENVTKHSSHGPPNRLPQRVTFEWIARTIPLMSAFQLRSLISELHKRGWTGSEIREGVMPHAPTRPIDGVPRKITEAFLEERAIFLPEDQADELVRALVRRGWIGSVKFEAYVPRARFSFPSDA